MPGADNSLKISVQYYEPRVQCSGTVAPSLLPSCQNIVDTMPADKIMTTWGPEDDPLAHTKLPMTLFSRKSTLLCPFQTMMQWMTKLIMQHPVDRRCKLTITDDGRPDTFSRYQFWTAAVALVGICVRGEQVGLRKNLGKSQGP